MSIYKNKHNASVHQRWIDSVLTLTLSTRWNGDIPSRFWSIFCDNIKQKVQLIIIIYLNFQIRAPRPARAKSMLMTRIEWAVGVGASCVGRAPESLNCKYHCQILWITRSASFAAKEGRARLLGMEAGACQKMAHLLGGASRGASTVGRARDRRFELQIPLSNLMNNTLRKFRGKRRSRAPVLDGRRPLVRLIFKNVASLRVRRAARARSAGRARQKIWIANTNVKSYE